MDEDPDDPLARLRREAYDLAADDVNVLMSVFGRQARDGDRAWPQAYFRGSADDREGEVSLNTSGM